MICFDEDDGAEGGVTGTSTGFGSFNRFSSFNFSTFPDLVHFSSLTLTSRNGIRRH